MFRDMFYSLSLAAVCLCAAIPSMSNASTALTGTVSGDTRVVSGAASDHAIPWGMSDTDTYLTTTNDGTFTFDNLAANARSITFLHGSIDSYNVAYVLGIGGAVLKTLNYVGNGDQGPGGSKYETFFFKPGTVTGIGFHSGGTPAFEAGNFTSDVPEPAVWALMLAGFGMVGYSARRRAPAALAS